MPKSINFDKISDTKRIYSYSMLNAFAQCPMSFYLSYIEKVDKEQNAFSQHGILMHELIERWAKKEITAKEMPLLWKRDYAKYKTLPCPAFLESKGYAEKMFVGGLKYLESFNGFPQFSILAAEKPFKIEISGRPFRGVIDLIAKEKDTDNIVIIDHKSKSAASFKKSRPEMERQLLLYSAYIQKEYGVFPKKIGFNLFQAQTEEYSDFNEKQYNEAVTWATEQIEKIEKLEDECLFDLPESHYETFFCENLCSVRKSCRTFENQHNEDN